MAKKDGNAEEKIKEAARKLFTQKGFAATRTRDIAEEAGINLALLNYYFRSKEKLFEIIMRENLQQFMGIILQHFSKEKLTFEERISFLVSNYIDMLIRNPDLPLFVMYEIRSGQNKERPSPQFEAMNNIRHSFVKEIEKLMSSGKVKKVHPLHVVSNIIGLTVFPFLAAPILTERLGKMSRKQFNELMLERKKLIPIWIKAMLTAK